LGLEIEEQRTNLLQQSETFDNAFWFKNNWSVLSNSAVAPDGNLTADKMVENTATGFHSTYTSSSQGTLTGAHTFSVYLKQAGRSWAIVRFNNVNTWFDLANGVTGTVGSGITASITPVGNGWFRCSVTATISAYAVFCEILMTTANNGGTYTGDGFSGIYVWGGQFEAGAFATSYIPTVASQVTRSADVAVMTGTNFSSWYRADEGTLYSDFVCNGLLAVGNAAFFVSDGTTSNRIGVYASTTNTVGGFVSVANTAQANMTATLSQSSQGKTAISYRVNNFAFSLNGAAPITDTTGHLPVVNAAAIGSIPLGGTTPLNGTIRKIAFYPARVTNAELQGITTV
jgi:hypothetical protein